MVKRLFRNAHRGVTLVRVLKAVDRFEAGLPCEGICIACGCDTRRVHFMARHLECWVCGKDMVFSVSELLSELVSNDNRNSNRKKRRK